MPNSIAVIERTSPLTTKATFHVKQREADALISSGQCIWAIEGKTLRKTAIYGRLYGEHQADVGVKVIRITATEDNRFELSKAADPSENGRHWLELHFIVEYPQRLGSKRVHEWEETAAGLVARLKSAIIGPYCDWNIEYCREQRVGLQKTV